MSDQNLPLNPDDPDNLAPRDEAQLPAVQGPPLLPAKVQHYITKFHAWADRNTSFLDSISEFILPHNEQEPMAPENISRGAILFGVKMGFLIFGVFLLWATLAPIESAAVASGKVVLDSSRKTIDHLEGGIIKKIFVREGQVVNTGDPLIEMDDIAVRAKRDLFRGQYISAKATEARLIAERDNLKEVQFPKDLLDEAINDVTVASNVDAQRRMFESRREAVIGKTEVLGQQIKQSAEEINGLKKQISASSSQLGLLGSEISDVKHLLQSGNAPKTRLLALQRAKAQLEGERGERQAMIARAQQQINEAKIQMYNLKTEFLNEVMQELKDTQVKLSDLQEQLRAAEDVMQRVTIRAPIAGAVVGLKVFTQGGVIGQGEKIMDIVPSNDKLIVEAHIQPQDIDVVRPGLKARLHLTAYKTRKVPTIEGEVVTVSADRFDNERTGEAYFVARIEVNEEQLDKLDGVQLSPGMPAEVLIVTGARSLAKYLFSPIQDYFDRAFREE